MITSVVKDKTAENFYIKITKEKKKTVYYRPKHGKRNNTYFPEECIANLLQESTGLIRIE